MKLSPSHKNAGGHGYRCLPYSSFPGHAMKVTDHAGAQGEILGKAMTGLSEGIVLVTLQSPAD